MTKAEFIQQAALGAFKQGFKDPWGEAQSLANAAPSGTFDAAPSKPASAGGASGGVFPPFGQSKGEPIHGASERTLRFYAGAAVRTLSDPAKERFHDKERAILAAYVNELERQNFDASEFKQAPQDSGRRAPPVQQTMPDDADSEVPF